MPEKPQMPPTFARTNDRGLVEIVDITTGRIVCVQASQRDLLSAKWENLTKIETAEGPVWIEKHLNFDVIPRLRAFPFSPLLGDLLCERLILGDSLVSAAGHLGIPYPVVIRWRRENENFAKALAEARRDRAEFFHDEVLATARGENISAKEKIAALQWATEVSEADRFQKKTKISGDKDAPISFVLSTGIQRPGDPGYATEVSENVAVTTLPPSPGDTAATKAEPEGEEIAEFTGGTDV